MSTKIAIIGLGQAGASVGLALGSFKEKITRIGHSANAKLLKRLETEGAFDKTEVKLNEAVRDVDLVIMDYPTDLIKDGLTVIAKEVKPDTVIICFTSVFGAVYEWAHQLLPSSQAFILMHPVIKPERLPDWNDTLLTAHPDFFENCDMVIVTDSDTSSRAMQMATDLCSLLKANPYFTEPMEADGFFARVEQLPLLGSAAIVNALINSPSWGDARRIAARSFFRTASNSMLYDEEEFFGITSLMNSQNISRVLDELMAELAEMRRMIEEKDEEGLKQTLKEARQGYALWLEQRTSGEWEKEKKSELPKPGSMMERLFGARPPRIKDS